MRPKISVVNRQRKRPLDTRACRIFAELALDCVRQRIRKAVFPEEIAVYFVSDKRIRAIHHQFLSVDQATDVITFHHGEIFISTETAEVQARQFSTGFLEEIHLYLVHGLLHLAGLDDQTERGYKEMAALQKEILREINGILRSQRAHFDFS